MLASPLHGVIPALITPLTATGEVDVPGLHRMLDHVLAGGVHAVSILGSTGEGPSLSPNARRTVVAETVAHVGGRVPVIGAVAPQSADAALAELSSLAAAGVDASLVLPPYYYPTDQQGLLDFFRTVGEVSPLPILLYNIPHMTKLNLAPATVAALSRIPRVVGIKDSIRDFDQLQELVLVTAHRPDFAVLTGYDGYILAATIVGVHGVIGAGVNLAPEVATSLYAAARDRDLDRALPLQERLTGVVRACRRGLFPAGHKAAAALLGLCGDAVLPPSRTLLDSERAALADDLRSLGFLA